MPQDRYILANMILITCVAFWHGIQTLLPEEEYPNKNLIAILVLASSFFLYNVIFVFNIITKVSSLTSSFVVCTALSSFNIINVVC